MSIKRAPVDSGRREALKGAVGCKKGAKDRFKYLSALKIVRDGNAIDPHLIVLERFEKKSSVGIAHG